jgi:hypothetical protein
MTFGSVSLVSDDNRARGSLQPFQAVQQSADAGSVPFAAPCRWYLSLVQPARDGLEGDEARCPKITNCRGQRTSSRVRGPLVCQSIVDPAIVDSAIFGREQIHVRQYPHDGGVVPPAAMGGRYSSSVQFIRQRPARNEASRPELTNDRDQGVGAGVCGPLER